MCGCISFFIQHSHQQFRKRVQAVPRSSTSIYLSGRLRSWFKTCDPTCKRGREKGPRPGWNQARVDADANAEKLPEEFEAIRSEFSSKNLQTASKELISAHALTEVKCATLQERQTSLGQRLGKFIESLEDMTIKEIKAAALCIENDFH